MATAYLGLGSNLGNGKENLYKALLLIEEQIGPVLAVSSFVESEPWGFESEHRFTNAVCVVETDLAPLQLLDQSQFIERQLGRNHKHRPGESYTDRIIDIDILTYDNLQYADDRLTLPHPLIEKRDFVWIPMDECRQKLIKNNIQYK